MLAVFYIQQTLPAPLIKYVHNLQIASNLRPKLSMDPSTLQTCSFHLSTDHHLFIIEITSDLGFTCIHFFSHPSHSPNYSWKSFKRTLQGSTSANITSFIFWYSHDDPRFSLYSSHSLIALEPFPFLFWTFRDVFRDCFFIWTRIGYYPLLHYSILLSTYTNFLKLFNFCLLN